MKKNVLLSLGITIATAAVATGVSYAVKRNGGLARTMIKLKQTPVIAGAIDKFDDIRSRLAANDDRQNAAAA